MPLNAPPDRYTGTPTRWTLALGTQLWRVHHQSYVPVEFKGKPADRHFGGGRFDGTVDDPYPYLYAGLTQTTALAETLVRALPFVAGRPRLLPRKAVAQRKLCALEVTAELQLIALITTAHLAAVRQDEWLVQAEPRDYAFTRRWAHWLRSQAPWAHGMIWGSRRDLGEQSIVLFGDRCPAGALALGAPGCQQLYDEAGAATLNSLLASYQVHVRPPRDKSGASR